MAQTDFVANLEADPAGQPGGWQSDSILGMTLFDVVVGRCRLRQLEEETGDKIEIEGIAAIVPRAHGHEPAAGGHLGAGANAPLRRAFVAFHRT